LTKYLLCQPLKDSQYMFIPVEAVMPEPIPRDKVRTY
jgi:hypothetical protein